MFIFLSSAVFEYIFDWGTTVHTLLTSCTTWIIASILRSEPSVQLAPDVRMRCSLTLLSLLWGRLDRHNRPIRHLQGHLELPSILSALGRSIKKATSNQSVNSCLMRNYHNLTHILVILIQLLLLSVTMMNLYLTWEPHVACGAWESSRSLSTSGEDRSISPRLTTRTWAQIQIR